MKISELSCFRKAAELGCDDFRLDAKAPEDVSFIQDENSINSTGAGYHSVPYAVRLRMNPRIARAASARCIEWWKRIARTDAPLHLKHDGKEMIRQARAFGRKVGVEYTAKKLKNDKPATKGALVKAKNNGKWDDNK